jgi:hypothetical protein
MKFHNFYEQLTMQKSDILVSSGRLPYPGKKSPYIHTVFIILKLKVDIKLISYQLQSYLLREVATTGIFT